ncbi:MAG TPA: DUF3575 domain-containing protein, partial [Polyangiaceae bacterium]|nr:DUF3575 domain-containing protein [Polyangiaceae bacterium]
MPVRTALLCLKFGCALAANSAQWPDDDSVSPSPTPELGPEIAPSPAVPHGAIELNPLPVIFGKLGGNIEIALATHHALILSPAYFDADYFHGPELEIGYRYYFFQRTLSGPFVGLGIMGAAFQYHREPGSDCGPGGESCSGAYEPTQLYGATIEAGWQWIIRDWLLLGVGGGLEAQHA